MRRPPSQLRFLVPAFSAAAPGALILFAVDRFAEIACRIVPARSCHEVPAELVYLAFAAISVGVVASVYRWYRDFVLGDYHLDLVDPGRWSR